MEDNLSSKIYITIYHWFLSLKLSEVKLENIPNTQDPLLNQFWISAWRLIKR